ncbi:MAG: hypothetical protein UW95_C0024G0007 [Parcubacteria group bacterium GW2011_GWC1_45_14]|nr:MAG: hypothetical protein UW95_C0024G0007 [Parcubacteria group bacterium GW2011_GWC1_45_14]
MNAQAITAGFGDDDKELYFTWYLKKTNGLDLDEDGDYDENDWKIEAARIIAANGYDGESNGNTESDGNGDGYKALPDWDGRNDNDDPNCYVQNFDDGRIYELKETTESFSCANAVCASTRTPLTCEYEDLPDNPGTFITESGKSACQLETSTPKCEVIDAENFTAGATCESGEPLCLSSAFASSFTTEQMCSEIGRGELGSSCSSLGAPAPTCSFKEKSEGNICKHLFPKPKGIGEESGDDEFGDEEEQFWGTDNRNISTAGNGNLDEANVIGLGITTFEWRYEDGDKVGVVVEGDSIMNTKHNDGERMRMWAFSKNTCDAISDAAEERRFYLENNYGLPSGILTIGEIDLDDCLEENLLNPKGVNESGYLDVNVAVSPSEPINDPLGVGSLNRGSVITATAVINNSDPSRLLYEWDVEISSDGTSNPPLWKNITDNITEHSYFSGLGNSELKFKLNFSYEDGIFPNRNEEQYLRIKAFVSEGDGVGKNGKGMSIVKIGQLGPEITPYKAVYSETAGKLSLGGQICSSANPENIGKICFVSNNEVIGASIPDEDGNLSGFNWKLNGAPLSCDSNISNGCLDGSAANLAFFPVIGMEGDVIEISAEAFDADSGLTKNFSKKFQIIKPYVRITSADTNQTWPKQLGYYKNLDGTFSMDVSENLFQAVEGLQVRLNASFFPDFIANPETTQVTWMVNGESFSGTDKASFTVTERPGRSYNVSINATYSQPISTRKALEKIWGVSQMQTAEENLEHAIQIEVIESEYDETVALKNGTKKFLANIASNMPQQALFLLKIILTGAMLIGISGLVFSIAPSIGKKE